MNPKKLLPDAWNTLLFNEFNEPYFKQLTNFLAAEKKQGKCIYPPEKDIFNAFTHTAFTEIKVVIIGQDPYHGQGQAQGLCFSVPVGMDVPPSLKNIYKELQADLLVTAPDHGCLTAWAAQGVLLLNAVLTVEHASPGSHQHKGWEQFTDGVIQLISEGLEGVVFFLWGNYAQRKATLIDGSRHLLLSSVHPSPLSAYRGFFGCRHFSKANDYLQLQAKKPIDWQLPNQQAASNI